MGKKMKARKRFAVMKRMQSKASIEASKTTKKPKKKEEVCTPFPPSFTPRRYSLDTRRS